MKIRYLVLLAFTAVFAMAQQDPATEGPAPGQNPLTLASQFFEKNNFFNYYAFASAVYDTYNPTLDSSGKAVNNGGLGYNVGGGLAVRHIWQKSILNLTYSGDYRDYASSFFSSGTDQNLGLNYSLRLARHWNLNVGVGAGAVLYGTGYVGSQQTTLNAGNLQLNPFSNSSRYVTTSTSLTYQQTRRLSYVGSGSFYLQRYSYSGAVGATGGSGDIGVFYRITSRTTISGDYSHSYFVFQRGAGTSSVNNYYGSISHRFANHWTVYASGGLSQSHVTGNITVPVSLITSDGQALNGFATGPYNSTSYLPSFQGTVSRLYRKQSLSISGGQSVVSGNGYYLASRNIFLNGFYNKNFRKSALGLGGNYNRLNSVANSVAYSYNTTGFSASYGYPIFRRVFVNGRYDYLQYGTLRPNPAINDSRLSFGISYSSQGIPITLF